MGDLLGVRVLLLGCCIYLVYTAEEGVKTAENTQKCSPGESGCSIDNKAREASQIRLSLPIINGVKVGYEQEIELTQGRKHKMKTLSLAPPVFEIPDLFSADECELVVDMATEKGLRDSPVITDPREISNNTSKATFDEWDTNSDGFVDADEIIYLPGKSDLYFTDEDVQKMFDTLGIDQDGNGKMSLEEFYYAKVDAIKGYFEELRQVKSRLRSRNSQHTWLWHDEDELLKYEELLEDYHDRFAHLTRLPKKMIENTEPLQVVRYDEHGHSHCHHDSEIITRNNTCCTYGATDCRLCRYLTVHIFLNDVEAGGELAFPVADDKTFTWQSWTKESKTKCNMAKHCSESNLIVKPEKGKAIMFYNHLVDPKTEWMSALDPRGLHGGCDVTKGDKWVANAWINVVGDGINELRSWKMNSNWLSGNNINQEIVSALQRVEKEEEILEEEVENRYTREKNVQTSDEDETLELPPDRVGEKIEVEVDKRDAASTPEDASQAPPLPQEVEPELIPRGPPVKLSVTPAPLPLPKEQLTPKEPSGPKVPVPPLPKEESGNRILRSVLLLIDELDQVELEIVARNLHTRLKLVCVPLIMNPMGSF